MIPMPHPLYSHDLTPSNSTPPHEKSPQREMFCHVEEVKQKTAEALKGIKTDKFKTVLNSGKNVSIGALHQMESTLKVTEV